MGSKNLKGVVVNGTHKIGMADLDGMKMACQLTRSCRSWAWHKQLDLHGFGNSYPGATPVVLLELENSW